MNQKDANNIRQIVEGDALDACAASYVPPAAPDQEYLDKLAGWCLKMQLIINGLMDQALIDKMVVQLADKGPREQKEVLERWADARVLEQLAGLLERDGHQGFVVQACNKTADRLRHPGHRPKNLEYARNEAVALAVVHPRHRHIIEGLYLADEDVLYEIAVLADDENEVPFSSEED